MFKNLGTNDFITLYYPRILLKFEFKSDWLYEI